MRVLLVEDKLDLLNSIYDYLNSNNNVCDAAPNIFIAREKIAAFDYDCVILDLTLPVGNGLDILKELKSKKSKSGVIIISAKDSLNDKLLGLELGADDYLTKPFHLAELSARVQSIYRRRSFEGNNEIHFDKLHINIQDMIVSVNGQFINLTKKEYELLLYFLSNKNKVITKEAILDHLWKNQPNTMDNYDLIYVHIKNLRKKLSDKDCPDYLSAVYGLGYRFSIPKPHTIS